jgi:hypothetical protein
MLAIRTARAPDSGFFVSSHWVIVGFGTLLSLDIAGEDCRFYTQHVLAHHKRMALVRLHIHLCRTVQAPKDFFRDSTPRSTILIILKSISYEDFRLLVPAP